MKRYLQVVLSLPLRRSFTYSIPETITVEASEGMRVLVPFGRKEVVGYVSAEIDKNDIAVESGKIKDVIRFLDEEPLISNDVLELCRWGSGYYHCGYGELLKAAIPSFVKQSREKIEKFAEIVEREGKGIEEWRALCKNAFRQLAVLELLIAERRAIAFSEIKDRTGSPASVIMALKRKGLVNVSTRKVRRKPFLLAPGERKAFILSHDQEHALREIDASLENGRFRVFLLKGVTGSGKTEVYLRSIERSLKKGKDALYLVPEIALTPMLAREITGRFGGKVAIMHSALTPGERFDEWMRIRNGEAKIVLGARSAVFAPLRDLGIIFVDEEQDASYKQEDSPRYNGRDLAIVRARSRNIPIVLGSATPSLESYRNALEGKYRLLEMKSRVEERPLPEVAVIDMKEEFKKKGEIVPVSDFLFEKIEEKIQSHEQVLILLNRRGFSSFVQCRECGNIIVCPRCSISLTFHKAGERLLCHYCGYWKKKPEKCPSCNSESLYFGGEGTEKVENMIKERLPLFRIARMDRDAVRGRGGHARILGAFEQKEIDLLVGTQMIAKGHDFPSVTLVGIIAADRALTLPDFRASERTFQLITQVSGRAGRGNIPGLVLLQAYHSGHHAIQSAVKQDYGSFYEKEIRFRRVMKYPPFTVMANIIVQDRRLSRGMETSKKIGNLLKKLSEGKIAVLGPAVAPIAKLKRGYRFQIVLKAKQRKEMGELLRRFLESAEEALPLRNVIIDVDPISLM